MSNFHIKCGLWNDTTVTKCYQHVGDLAAGQSFNFPFNVSHARYIYVGLARNIPLNFCELKVYGELGEYHIMYDPDKILRQVTNNIKQ